MRDHFTFDYSNEPNFLARLVQSFNNECQVSVTLEPDNEELTDLKKDFKPLIDRIERNVTDHEIVQQLPTLIKILRCCKENGIIPFWKLEFSRETYGRNKIEYCGPNYGMRRGSEPFRSLEAPSVLINAKKWYKIEFKGFGKDQDKETKKAERQIREVKQAVSQLTQTGYEITEVTANIGMSWAGSGYYERVTSEASLYAWSGKLQIFGVSEHFDEETLRALPPISLPQVDETTKLLEYLGDLPGGLDELIRG